MATLGGDIFHNIKHISDKEHHEMWLSDIFRDSQIIDIIINAVFRVLHSYYPGKTTQKSLCAEKRVLDVVFY